MQRFSSNLAIYQVIFLFDKHLSNRKYLGKQHRLEVWIPVWGDQTKVGDERSKLRSIKYSFSYKITIIRMDKCVGAQTVLPKIAEKCKVCWWTCIDWFFVLLCSKEWLVLRVVFIWYRNVGASVSVVLI